MDVRLHDPGSMFKIDRLKRDHSWNMPYFHYHHTYELYFLEEGSHSMLMGDSIFDVTKHDVALIKPSLYHKSGGGGYIRTCIYFSDKFLRQFFTDGAIQLLLDCFKKDVISLSKDNFIKIKKLLSKIEKEYRDNRQSFIFVYLCDILLILNENKDNLRTEPLVSPYKKLAPILAYINKNYDKIVQIEDISDNFYITKFHLCRIFKEQTGLTVMQYLNNIKIQYACDMLANTKLTVTEIGFACGFNSSMYFCKTFRQLTQMTPTEFRKTTV